MTQHTGGGDSAEHTIASALKGMESPFSFASVMQGMMGRGGGGRGPESGGGMGDAFNAAKAQASIDKGMMDMIYKPIMEA